MGKDNSLAVPDTKLIHYNDNMNLDIANDQPAKPFKIPRSTLIVIHNDQREVMLMERADHPGYWQSVTGSQDSAETLRQTALREVREETGIDATNLDLIDWQQQNEYEIYEIWRHRYAPGVSHNREHVFALCIPSSVLIVLNPREHLRYVWLPIEQAAAACFSATNRDAILALPSKRLTHGGNRM